MKRGDALKVTCPKCGAPPSFPCMGKKRARVACHIERHPNAWDGRKGPSKNVRSQRCNEQGWVYFIGPVAAETVKIGWTKDSPEKRLRTLQTGNGEWLHLFGAIPGTIRDERGLHDRFAHLHLRGEWFTFAKEIWDIVPESVL